MYNKINFITTPNQIVKKLYFINNKDLTSIFKKILYFSGFYY